ncbi:MAG: hypothetical protein QFX35_02835 [Candidatus Verstraetearchaeota archaeon]|nr:hypothetical protein [Candidatus Verstraetearchaeota archaeon]
MDDTEAAKMEIGVVVGMFQLAVLARGKNEKGKRLLIAVSEGGLMVTGPFFSKGNGC